MTEFLKIFIPAFLLFAVVGAIAGYDARNEVVRDTLFEQMEVKKHEDRYMFEYPCEETGLSYLYNIDTAAGSFDGSIKDLMKLQATALELPTERFKEYRSLISAFLGGATGGVQLQSLLRKPKTGGVLSRLQKTIAGLIGMATGYSLGHWLGSRYNTDCDSTLYIETVRDPVIQTRLEQARLSVQLRVLENLPGATVSEAGNAIVDWEKDPAFMCSSRLKTDYQELRDYLRSDIEDPSSKQFRLIDTIAALHAKISASTEYETLVAGQLYRHNQQILEHSKLAEIANEKNREWDEACQKIARM